LDLEKLVWSTEFDAGTYHPEQRASARVFVSSAQVLADRMRAMSPARHCGQQWQALAGLPRPPPAGVVMMTASPAASVPLP